MTVLVVASRIPGDPPLTSAFPVADIVCEDPFDYWAGLASVWDTDADLVNVEHDMEFSDMLVEELCACPRPLCAYPYLVKPFGWSDYVWSASFGGWITEGRPVATFSAIGFAKLTAEVRRGTTLQRAAWDKVERSVHHACVNRRHFWHVHWPAIAHHHDYSDPDTPCLPADVVSGPRPARTPCEEPVFMFTVTNPTGQDLFCEPLQRVLAAGETVEVTESQAVAVSPSIFRIEHVEDEPAPAKPARPRGGAQTGKAAAVEER